jgi:hypothetical protein
MSFLSVHSRNSLEGIFGGRYQVYEAMYHSLFQRLKAAGAELVFFIDGPVQDAKDHVWLKRQTEKYQNCIDFMDKMAKGDMRANEIIRSTRNCPNIHLFESEFPSICKMYGRTFVSYYNECDLEVAAFACINNALAVIADDSDYLIHRGEWRYWSARLIDVENLTTFEYDRIALRQCLRLSDDQMRLLATIGGNDVLKYELVEHFHGQLSRGTQGKFFKIAQYIRDTYRGPGITQKDILMLCEHIFERTTNEIFDLVRQSLRIYDVDQVQYKYEHDNLLRFAMDRGKTQLYSLLADKVVNFTLLFDDLRHRRSNFEIALPLIRRQMGIVLQHRGDAQLERNVCTKRTHNEPFSTFSLVPEYPDIQIPPLLEFYHSAEQPNDRFMGLRLDLLVWFMGSSRINRKVLNELPPTHLLSILTLNYLREVCIATIFTIFALITYHFLLVNSKTKSPSTKLICCC